MYIELITFFKMNLRKIFIALIVILWFGNATTALANIDHFEVNLGSETLSIDNYTDLEIKAMDADNNVITDYTWEILIMSMSDDMVELPASIVDYSYTFKEEDKWVVKFENWVKFTATWTQDISVFDSLDTNIVGIAEIEVSESEAEASAEISISTPEAGTQINSSSTSISWTTTKNHSVKIIVNGETEISTTSDNSWNFAIQADNLNSWENTIKAQVLDADGNILWESAVVSITSNTEKPVLESFSATPEVIKENEKVTFEIMANSGLKEVSIIFNDEKIQLNEESAWIYKASKFVANEGSYDVTINLTNDYEIQTTVLQERAVKVEKEEIPEPVVEEEPIVEEEPVIEKVEKVTWIKVTKFKDRSVISWDAQDAAESYNVYKKDENGETILVDNVTENKFVINISGEEVKYEDFMIKAVWLNEEWLKEENPEFSEMVKVQTWPAEVLFVLFFAMILGYMILRRKNA